MNLSTPLNQLYLELRRQMAKCRVSFHLRNHIFSDVVEFADVMGQVPDDFDLFDCAEAGEGLLGRF